MTRIGSFSFFGSISQILRKLKFRRRSLGKEIGATEYILKGRRENPKLGVLLESKTLYRGKSEEELKEAIEKFKNKYKLELIEINFHEVKMYELPEKKLKGRMSFRYSPGFIIKEMENCQK